MKSRMKSDTTQGSHETGAGRGAARSLLLFGLLAGPFYLGVGLTQALTRDGFDLARHPLSLLANGPGGWVQTANFLVTGVMVVAAAVGIRQVLGSKARAATWFLGGFGLSMVVAAIFPADPVDGFPAGTPEGFPISISPVGLTHFAAGSLGFLCIAISGLCAALALRRLNLLVLAWFSLLSGLAVMLGFFGGMALPMGIFGIWFAVIVGWIWLATVSLRLYRLT